MIESRIIKISHGLKRYVPQARVGSGWKEYSTQYNSWCHFTSCINSKRCFTKFGALLFLKMRAKEILRDRVVWEGKIEL